MSSRQVTGRRGTQHPPARLPTARAVSNRQAAQPDDEDEGESRRPARAHTRGRQRRSPFAGKSSKETREWVFAGGVFVVLILGIVLGIHVIGGGTSSTTANGRPTFGNPPGGFGPGGNGAGNAAVTTAVAQALGISSDTLTGDLQQGMTVAEIAAAQNVSIDTVNTAYLNAVKARFDSAVSSGTFTQAQADQIYSLQQQQVANGQYPLLTSGSGATARATATS